MGGSAQKVSVGQAENYYYGKDCIYAKEGQGSNMQWLGEGAKTLGLEGKFKEGDMNKFTNLLYGKDPSGTTQLIGVENSDKNLKNAGTDIALHLPKSFGIAAMEDPQAREAISRAFETVAGIIEEYVQGRQQVDGKTETVKAEMIAVMVEHGLSRRGDTHPHAHVFVLDNTIRQDKSHCALENKAIMNAQSSIQQDLYNEAVKEMKAVGYDFTYEKMGSHIKPEVKGIDQETRDLFSKRLLEDIKGKGDNTVAIRNDLQERMPSASEHTIDRMMQQLTKEAKDPTLTEEKVVASHRAQAEIIGKNLPEMVGNAKKLSKENIQAHTPAEYVKYALADNIEKESVVRKESVINDAIKLGCGDVVRSDIEKAFDEAQKSGEIRQLGKNAYSTPEMVATEKSIAITAVTEATRYSPLLSKEATLDAIKAFEDKKGWEVSKGQRDAISLVLGENTARIAFVAGDAGAGKSQALMAVNDSLKNMPDIKVMGLGFQGKASSELERSSGIVSQTIHSFLGEQECNKGQIDNVRKLIVVDEASMVDTKQFGALKDYAQQNNGQLVFVGDGKQISAIGAGAMFNKLQEYNLVKTAHMSEVKRQKYYDIGNNEIKAGGDISQATNKYAVEMAQNLKRGDFEGAFEKLSGAEQIKELAGKDDRLQYAAEKFINSHKDTVLLTMTNMDRKSAIEQIRPMQKIAGQIAQKDHTFKTNDPIPVSGVYRRIASSYTEGNYVTIGKNIGDLKAGSVIKIAEVDNTTNKICFNFADPDNQLKVANNKMDTVEGMKADGAKGEISLKENGNSLAQFQKVDTSFSIDEKVMILKNNNTQYGKSTGQKNGVTGYIRELDENTGIAKIELESGKIIEQQMEGAYLTNGQAMTVNKSQGISERHVVLLATAQEAGGLANTKTGYTALTRHEQSIEVVTDNKTELLEAISREANKTSTLDYMPKEEMAELQAKAAEIREGQAQPDDGIKDLRDRAEESRIATQPQTELEKIESNIMQMAVAENTTDLAKENIHEPVKELTKDSEQQVMQAQAEPTPENPTSSKEDDQHRTEPGQETDTGHSQNQDQDPDNESEKELELEFIR